VTGAILVLWDVLGSAERLVTRDSWDLRAILDTLGPRVTREMSACAVLVEMPVWLANKARMAGMVSEGRSVVAAAVAVKAILAPWDPRVQWATRASRALVVFVVLLA
jgi:hypothetical protein